MLVAASFHYAELVAVTGISFKMYLDNMLNNDLHQDSILAAIPSHPLSEAGAKLCGCDADVSLLDGDLLAEMDAIWGIYWTLERVGIGL